MENRNILIVEDDPTQFGLIEEELRRKLEGINFTNIQTESEFYDRFEDIIQSPPDLILMDMMLRWTDPAPEMPDMPEEVVEEGYYRAGIRCLQKLIEANTNGEIPVLLFTILGQEDIREDLASIGNPQNIRLSYLQKTARIAELIKEILSIAPSLKVNLIE